MDVDASFRTGSGVLKTQFVFGGVFCALHFVGSTTVSGTQWLRSVFHLFVRRFVVPVLEKCWVTKSLSFWPAVIRGVCVAQRGGANYERRDSSLDFI